MEMVQDLVTLNSVSEGVVQRRRFNPEKAAREVRLNKVVVFRSRFSPTQWPYIGR